MFKQRGPIKNNELRVPVVLAWSKAPRFSHCWNDVVAKLFLTSPNLSSDRDSTQRGSRRVSNLLGKNSTPMVPPSPLRNSVRLQYQLPRGSLLTYAAPAIRCNYSRADFAEACSDAGSVCRQPSFAARKLSPKPHTARDRVPLEALYVHKRHHWSPWSQPGESVG